MVKTIFLEWHASFIDNLIELHKKEENIAKIVLPNLDVASELSLNFLKSELSSPEILTLKQFFAGLVTKNLKTANTTIKLFAWHQVLKNSDHELLKQLFPGEFKFSKANLFHLARRINQITSVIYSTNHNFLTLANLCQEQKIDNQNFWQGLHLLEVKYEELLKDNGYQDVEQKLIHLNDIEAANKKIVVAGCQNLMPQASKLIENLAKKNEILIAINCSKSFASGYTEYGSLNTKYWEGIETKIKEECLEFCEDPQEEASLVAKYCKNYDNLCIYISEVNNIKVIASELDSISIKYENHLSQNICNNNLIKLILCVIDYSLEKSSHNLARLIRNNYIRKFISKSSDASDLIHQINIIRSSYYPKNLNLDCEILKSKLESHSQTLTKLNNLIYNFNKQSSLEEAISNLVSEINLEISEEDTKCLSILLENVAKLDKSKLKLDSLSSLKEIIYSLSFSTLKNSSPIKLKTISELSLVNSKLHLLTGISDQTLPERNQELIYQPLANIVGLIDYSIANASYGIAYLNNANIEYKIFNSKLNLQGEPNTPSRFLFRANQGNNSELITKYLKATNHSEEHKYNKFEFSLPKIIKTKITKISASSFRDYINCPYLFYLKHILKLQSSCDSQLEMDGASFGKIAHLILENYSLRKKSNSTSKIEIEQIFQETIDSYFPWETYPVINLQLQQLFERIKSIKETQEELSKQGWEIAEVETKIEKLLNLNNKIIITGKIDRIDYNQEKNIIRIIDFKTSDKITKFTDIYKNQEWLDLQLPIYATWAKDKYKQSKIEIAYIHFSKLPSAFIEIKALEQDDFEEIDKQIYSITQNIIDNKFEPKNQENWPLSLTI